MKNCTIGLHSVKSVEGKTVQVARQAEEGMVELIFTDGSNLLISAVSRPLYGGGAGLVFLAEESELVESKPEVIAYNVPSCFCCNCGTDLWVEDAGMCPVCGCTSR